MGPESRRGGPGPNASPRNRSGPNNNAAVLAASEAMRRQQYASGQGQDGCGERQDSPPAAACVNPVAAQIYGCGARPAGKPIIATCCDPWSGCRPYRADSRDSFWPSFAHPRWLSCNELYCHGRPGPIPPRR